MNFFRLLFLTFIISWFLIPNKCFATRFKTYQGLVEILFIDSHDKPQKIYKLILEDGSKIILKTKKDPNFAPLEAVTIQGAIKNNKLYAKKIIRKKDRSLMNSNSYRSGNRKLLVVQVTDSGFSESFIPYTSSEINDFYFSDSISVKDYIAENSDTRLNITGLVIDTLAIPNLCQNDQLFDRSIEDTVLANVDTLIDDLDSYSYAHIIVPDKDECLANAAGIGTVGNTIYSSAKHGNIFLGVSFIRAYNQSSYEYTFLGTILHELGHNIGLGHANANSCGVDVFQSNACTGIEYGDGHSIMGTAPTLAHFNGIQKQDLGWLNSNQILTVDSDTSLENISLIPMASSAAGYKMIRIKRNDGLYYSIEYRQAHGYDDVLERSFLNKNFSGFLVYVDEENIGNRPVLIDSEFEDFRASSEYISGSYSYYSNYDMTSSMNERALFAVGEDFDDNVNKILVQTTELTTDAATINIKKGDDFYSDNSEGDENDNSDDEDFTSTFSDFKSSASEIYLKYKKPSKILLDISANLQEAQNGMKFKITKSANFKKITKVKKNSFHYWRDGRVKILVAPERKLIKQGYVADENGEYTLEVLIKQKSKRPSFTPRVLEFKVKSKDSRYLLRVWKHAHNL